MSVCASVHMRGARDYTNECVRGWVAGGFVSMPHALGCAWAGVHVCVCLAAFFVVHGRAGVCEYSIKRK